MSPKTLLNIPLSLERLKQGYAIMDQRGNFRWQNEAFSNLIDVSTLIRHKSELVINAVANNPIIQPCEDVDSVSIELEFQPYSEIVPEEKEELFLCMCKKVNIQGDPTPNIEIGKSGKRMLSILNESQRITKVGAWELDLSTKLTTWTDEVYRIHEVELDFNHNEEKGIEFYHPDDRKIIIEAIEKSIQEQINFDVIARLITAKNNLRWVRATGKPYIRNGAVIKLIGLIQDITEKVEIERQLIKEQTQLRRITERFRLAANAGSIGIWDYYPVENNLVWDEQTYKLYGVKESEFEGAYEAWERHVHPDDKEEAVNELGKALTGEKEFDTEFRVVHPDGTIRHLSGIATVIRNEQQEPIRMTGVNMDITERKLHIGQLNLLQAVVETALDSIMITEANLENPVILYANPAHEIMTGYSLEEIQGKSLDIFQGSLTDKKELKRIKLALKKGENVQSELFNYGKDGKEYWVSTIISYVRDQKGVISHIVSIQRDITNKKKNQEALIVAKEVAERASEAKSEFLSTMSHEIRTPLNAIIGMTGLLAETGLDEDQKNYLTTIRQGGESLISVINDILDYSKIEAGKVELEKVKFKLLSPLEDTLDLLSGKAFEKQIELMYATEKLLPKFVIGDITRLRQVLVNLIGNAIKFTTDGEILVKVQQVEVNDGKIVLEFSIQDTGIGIPKKKVNRLFQSFSQVDASTTRKFGGTGLGLAISRKLVELHGGKIWVESEVGTGSTFFFQIVVDQADDFVETNTHLPSLMEKRVLIVDDSQTNLSILQNRLIEVGMNVSAFSSPIEALNHIEKQKDIPWDLFILDFHMQKMNGLDLGKALRQMPAYKEIPMIMLSSGYEVNTDSQKELFDLIINKPVKKEKFIARIQGILGPSHVRGESIITHEKTSELDLSAFQILLVEDNQINQKVAKKMLEKFQGKIEIANNGLEALEYIKILSFDLVLMDMQMPEMDGLQATRAIRALNGIKQPLILAMTANASKSDRKACMDAGMNDFVSKPIKLEVLRGILQKWLFEVSS